MLRSLLKSFTGLHLPGFCFCKLNLFHEIKNIHPQDQNGDLVFISVTETNSEEDDEQGILLFHLKMCHHHGSEYEIATNFTSLRQHVGFADDKHVSRGHDIRLMLRPSNRSEIKERR